MRSYSGKKMAAAPAMETVIEDEEFSGRDVTLPSQIMERNSADTGRGRHILVAVDHGPKSRLAFQWALSHFCHPDDTLHLVHAVSSVKNELVYEASQRLMEKLAAEALETAMVRSAARIVEGEAGKVICKEATKLRPVAVVMGTRGRSLIQSVLQGSVSEYVFHNCKTAPVIIVPGRDESL